MSGKLKFLFALIYVVGFGYLMSFLAAGKNMGILDPKGAIAVEEKKLILIAVFLMFIIVVPVYILTIVFTWKYRASNQPEKYMPAEDKNSFEEFIWWLIPCVIIIILGSITWVSTHKLDPYKPIVSDVAPITIQVVALDWKWLFIYPEQGIATVGYLEIPKDTPVNFHITSDAPMNSFWIPQLAGQVYAMAGMNTQLHIIANEEGTYRGASANFSGEGFSGMRFSTKVVSVAEWNVWSESMRTNPTSLTHAAYEELMKPSQNDPESSYGTVDDGLYNDIIMKYMMPMEESPATNTRPVMEMDMDMPSHSSHLEPTTEIMRM